MNKKPEAEEKIEFNENMELNVVKEWNKYRCKKILVWKKPQGKFSSGKSDEYFSPTKIFPDEVFPDKVRVVTLQTELLTRIFLFLL